MNVVSFTDPADFAERARPVIERHPANSNILATVLATALDGRLKAPGYWFLIMDDAADTAAPGAPIAAAMQTPPFNLFLTPLPTASRELAIGALAGTLNTAGLSLPGVTATNPDAQAFADAWQHRTGLPQRLTMAELLYEIDAAPASPQLPGFGRLGTEADVPLAAGWLRSFNQEIAPSRGRIDAERAVRDRIANGEILLWDQDGEPVSMAGLHSTVAGLSRVGPVYTPGWHRRQGYGAAVTIAATRLGFERGAERCMLYANAANPTSNGIYQGIGYRQTGTALMIEFG